MSDIQTKSIARRFIQEIFDEGKIEDAKRFVTSDIIYHGVFEEVKGLENFNPAIGTKHTCDTAPNERLHLDKCTTASI